MPWLGLVACNLDKSAPDEPGDTSDSPDSDSPDSDSPDSDSPDSDSPDSDSPDTDSPDSDVPPVDEDLDGVSVEDGDCDDGDPEIFPGQTEICDGVDNDCDGAADEDFDADGDGWLSCGDSPDCDDGDAEVNPGAEEQGGDARDEDCDGRVDELDWVAGDLVITEVLASPDAVGAGDGVWIEVLNHADRAVSLNGLTLRTLSAEFQLISSEWFEPGALVVLAANDDLSLNGGVAVDVRLPGLALLSEGEALSIEVEGRSLDAVGWTASAPGASISLDPDHLDADDNDDEAWWCAGVDPWAAGSDRGTPGAANGLCASVDHDLDGYSVVDGDCDDAAADLSPGASERCDPDDLDEDCDGLADEADDSVIDDAPYYPDEDGDGYGDDSGVVWLCEAPADWVAVGGDCLDSDASVSPDASEVWYDGVDSDCSGGSDLDADGDGFDAATEGGDDCDDEDASVHPGATETWYDGIDADCAEDNDFDADGDGEDAALAGGADCDDSDAGVGPGNLEELGDGLDNDCDGVADPMELFSTIYGDGKEAYLGGAVCGAGDVDGDGVPDVLIGSEGHSTRDGEAYLFTSYTSGYVSALSATAILSTKSINDYLGSSVAGPGDLDGDGYDDLLIGAENAGSTWYGTGSGWVVNGPVTGTSYFGISGIRLYGDNDGAGSAVSGAGDVDGDGVIDLLIGARYMDVMALDSGGAYVLLGPVTASLELQKEATTWTGTEKNDWAGMIARGGGDLDGDGLDDLVVSSDHTNDDGDRARSAFVLLGPADAGGELVEDADALLAGVPSINLAVSAISRFQDYDGDGTLDLLVGAQSTTIDARTEGAALLLLGPVVSSMSLGDADLSLRGGTSYDWLGSAVDLADVDGDGCADLIVGAESAGGTTALDGELLIVLAGPLGALGRSDADAVVSASTDNARMGHAVAGAGDINGDGLEDLLLGAPDDSPWGTRIGGASVLLSSGW